MSNDNSLTRVKFGPWAMQFDTGPSMQLSTFWKRRIAMLPSALTAH